MNPWEVVGVIVAIIVTLAVAVGICCLLVDVFILRPLDVLTGRWREREAKRQGRKYE